jgi:SAM-dependent methyltransferase
MRVPNELRCPNHAQQPLSAEGGDGRVESSAALLCPRGCRVPVVRGVPRFVGSAHYASGFGIQWNAFRRTQLDSQTGMPIFRERLARCLGGSLEAVRGRSVLEAGCGAGPFTEVLLAAGARVFACDLSSAVEANYENNSQASDYFVCQADIRSLPVAPAAFEAVVCLGVVQHTPDPEETIRALAGYLKPGGTLVIDHYGLDYPYPLSRRLLRPVLIRLPAAVSTKLALGLSRALLPLHRLSRGVQQRRGLWRLRPFLLKHSPLVDHFDDYPQLGERVAGEWSVLNTHDTLTDRYKHLRDAEEIRDCLASCGLEEIEVSYGGNGVEARARRPAAVPAEVGEEVRA